MTAEPKPASTQSVLARVETSTVGGLVLNTLEDMKTVSQLILQSKLAPDSFRTSEQIFVGLQTGAEIGLKPMQALNSIVVINGKPTLWGDAALALVKKSGLLRQFSEKVTGDGDEMVATVRSVRIDGEGSKSLECTVETTFSVADAKTAKLWGKTGPWTTHPKRMLKYKARAFNLRDNFPDVLMGMHLTEEMYGEEQLPAPESDVAPRDERRSLAVPSSIVDTTRAPVQEPQSSPEPTQLKGESLTDDKSDIQTPETNLVTFQCPTCLRTYQYGRKEGQGVLCECGKGVLEEQDKPAEPSIEEKGDAASMYITVNGMYVEQNGSDFIEFAAYVLCLDESEVAPSKLTVDQLKQIKAYIETSGVAIN